MQAYSLHGDERFQQVRHVIKTIFIMTTMVMASSSSDELIVVDTMGRLAVSESSWSDTGSGGLVEKMWTDVSSESDDCIIIDDNELVHRKDMKSFQSMPEKIGRMQVKIDSNNEKHAKITCRRQPVSPMSSPSRQAGDSGYMALRRSVRKHRKLNYQLNRFYKMNGCHTTKSTPGSLVITRKSNRDRSHESLKRKRSMSTFNPHAVNTRSVTRRMGFEGCILDPPTQEDEFELREWPAEGMHERPVWPDPRYEVPKPPPQTPSELEVSVHHSLHAVLAMAAQVGKSTAGGDKIMEEVSLALKADELSDFPAQGIYSEPLPDIQDESSEKNDVLMNGMTDLMLYTGLLYCAVSSVPQEALAKYIDSLSIDSALQWFDEISEKD